MDYSYISTYYNDDYEVYNISYAYLDNIIITCLYIILNDPYNPLTTGAAQVFSSSVEKTLAYLRVSDYNYLCNSVKFRRH